MLSPFQLFCCKLNDCQLSNVHCCCCYCCVTAHSITFYWVELAVCVCVSCGSAQIATHACVPAKWWQVLLAAGWFSRTCACKMIASAVSSRVVARDRALHIMFIQQGGGSVID